jgi:undecaprenyl phosphate-alpha-L-ara4N flippase subunit ArnE
MTSKQIFFLLGIVAAISAGQVLFKYSAALMNGAQNAFAALLNPYLITALIVYGGATLAWIYLLRQVPLNIAYPFFALSFLFVPLLSTIIFREPFTLKMMAGSGMIVFGVYLFNS